MTTTPAEKPFEPAAQVALVDPANPAVLTTTPDEDAWPEGPPGGGSLFCFTVFIPWTVEPQLLELQQAERTSIFDCDDFALYSNPAGMLGNVQVDLLDMDMHVPRGGRWNTFLNTPMFQLVWDVVVKDGRWRQHDWVVKADPDTVFFPSRLRDIVASADYGVANQAGGRGVFIKNCFLGLHGPLEVLSRSALFSYSQQTRDPGAACSSDEREDVYLMECLLAGGAEEREDDRVQIGRAHV